jgi:hypothetical protein
MLGALTPTHYYAHSQQMLGTLASTALLGIFQYFNLESEATRNTMSSGRGFTFQSLKTLQDALSASRSSHFTS